MKKIILCTLAIAGAVTTVLCQQQVIIYPDVKTSKTDQMFDMPKPGSSRIRFDFRMMKENKLMIELSTLSQIDSIPTLDSLALAVDKSLKLLGDSLIDPLSHNRIDVIISTTQRIRVASYPQQSDVFSVTNGNVTQLKVEQDTLRITLWTKGFYKSKNGPVSAYIPYYLTFILNNLSDLTSLPFEDLTRIIHQVSMEVDKLKTRDKQFSGIKYFAGYLVPSGKNYWNHNLSRTGKVRFSTDPYVQSGFQYIRNSFVPSAGVGIMLTQKKSDQYEREWRLMWEPLFFFSRNADNKLVTDRNDFICFKQYSRNEFEGYSKKVVLVQNVSFGYLIRRKGNWFEKNTFKFSLPTGIQYENILLEPEFVFDNFFRHFSPSLKLTVIFE
jgi:hypothetical protein